MVRTQKYIGHKNLQTMDFICYNTESYFYRFLQINHKDLYLGDHHSVIPLHFDFPMIQYFHLFLLLKMLLYLIILTLLLSLIYPLLLLYLRRNSYLPM